MATLEEIGYTETFKIRTHEIDIYKRIKLPSLIQLMQEASMSNAIKLNVSVWDLEESKLSWVLVKKQIIIHRLPILGESITVVTYPNGIDRLFAYRDFIVKDENQKVIAEASSSWVLINTETRKLVKPTFTIPTPTDVDPLEEPKFKIALPANIHNTKSFEINWFDLDWNNHVNNVFLLRCVIEGSSHELLESKTISQINIQFKSEGLHKDILISNCSMISNEHTTHSLIRETDQKVVALAEIYWK